MTRSFALRHGVLAAFVALSVALSCAAQLKPLNDTPLTTQPRSWDDEKAICAGALLTALGPAADPQATVKFLLPARLLLRDGLADDVAKALGERVAAFSTVSAQGPSAPRMVDETLISFTQVSFLDGQPGDALLSLREEAFRRLDNEIKIDGLGYIMNMRLATRAARLTGHLGLRQRAIAALRQMGPALEELEARKKQVGFVTEVKARASAAISACCDAYQLTSDRWFIEQAVRWASIAELTAAPYPGRPGQPCAREEDQITAYAMQDLSEFDNSQPWRALAQGATNSAMYVQLRDGDNRGYLPSETVADDCPECSFDIPPIWLVLNECRLRGNSGEVRTRRAPGRVGESLINSAFDVPAVLGGVGEGTLAFTLLGKAGTAGYTVVVPAQDPKSVEGAGDQSKDGAALKNVSNGWLYHREAQALIIKSTMAESELRLRIDW